MSPALRRVDQLRLRASSEREARQTALAMEDALATATFPGDRQDRLILVRHLHLGALRPGLPPQSLARALEQAFARVVPMRLDALGTSAESAMAVAFESVVEAHIALALRLLQGPPPVEWFWTLAVPAWKPAAGRAEALRGLALALADRPEASTALRVWVGALARAGYAAAVWAALTPGDRRQLIERVVGHGPIDPEAGRQPGDFLAALGIGGGQSARRRERSPAERLGSGWASAGLEVDAPVDAPNGPPPIGRDAEPRIDRSGYPREEARGRRIPGEPAGDRLGDRSSGEQATAAGGSIASAPSGPPVDRGEPGAVLSAAREEASGGGGGSGPSVLRRGLAKPATDPGRTAAALPARGEGFPQEGGAPWESLTRAGGLLFLLNALDSMGFPTWLARRRGSVCRQQAFTLALLAGALEELGLPPADPLWGGLGVGPSTRREAGLTAWRLRRQGAVTLWRQRLRRQLRVRHRLGLKELVLRPGLLHSTATHLEMGFALDQVDLRIRCAGLDLDPGWLPWLGRVVSFRYGEPLPS